jgi:hypothetical protein
LLHDPTPCVIREYEKADNISGLDDYALTELDAWSGIMQQMEGLEEQLEQYTNITLTNKSVNSFIFLQASLSKFVSR